jgi:hypothetical protein
MKLSGNYDIDEVRRALQGDFSCQTFKTDSKKKPLGDNERITLELFFMRFDFYPKKKVLNVYSIGTDEKGAKILTPVMTLKE